MFYVQHKKHKKGISHKQLNRINRLAKKHIYENDKLYIKNKNDKYLEIPKIEDRINIIDKIHASVAHFGINVTYNKLKEKYFWPKMNRDVEQFIKKCEPCIRNSRGEDNIIYSENGLIYAPECERVYGSIIIMNITKCYQEIQIIFK